MKKLICLICLVSSMTTIAASSRDSRSGKKYEFTVQGGGEDYRLSPVQVSAMLFLDEDTLIGLKGGHHSGEDEQQTNIAVQFKHYTGNSFYVAGEVFYLNTTEDDDGFWSDIFDDEETYASYTSMGVGFRIGNQWTWRNFTMGCDWAGIGRRVGTFKKQNNDLPDTTFTLLNFIIGASF